MNLKRILPVAVIGIAVLALVAYQLLFKQPSTTIPQANSTSQQMAPNNQMAPQTNPAPQFDKPVSSKEPATLVPDGTDLKQYCEQYYSAWKSSDWNTAYEMQPFAKKESKVVDDFSKELQSYGMKSFEVGEPEIKDYVGTVNVKLDLGQNGIWTTSWTFVKNDKGQWTAQNSVTGMSQ